MKPNPFKLITSAVIAVFATTLGIQPGFANTELWVGVSSVSATTNWSDNANWIIPAGGAANGPNGNDVVFGDLGSINGAGLVNSVVNQNLLNPLSLTITNNSAAGNFHTIYIPPGISVTNANALTVGISGAAASYQTTVNIVGEGSFVQNGSFTVKNATSTGGSGQLPFLDLSGLSNFVMNAGASTLTVAGSGSDARGSGRVDLAGGTNIITVGTITEAVGSGNGGIGGTLNLGAGTNVINVGTINLAAGKANNATVKFLGATGGLRLRGVSGAEADGSVAMTFGNRSSSGSGTPTGTLDLTGGHPVDVKVNTITLGRSNQAGNGTGSINFDNGTFSATNIVMGVNSSSGVATGTLTVGTNSTTGTGGTFLLGPGGLSMANQTSTGGANGNLNVNGAMICNGNITKTTVSGTANISVAGTMTLAPGVAIGSVSRPIDNITLNNSALNVSPGSSALIIANNLVTSGGIDTINISSLPVILSYPKQYPILSYAGGLGGAGFDFELGSLPAGSPAYQGYISNNVDTFSVDLVLTNGPLPIGIAVWNGTVNGDWDTSTVNWTNSGAPAIFHQGDAVLFSDSASGTTTVNLTTNLQPGSLVISNSTKLYTFNGTGKLSGSTGLTKTANNTLILDNSGINDFLGGVTISGGTLQIGNNDASGNIPAAAAVQDDTALVFSRTDNVTLPNVITGNGSLTQNGAGKLTLTSPNAYLGNTTIRNGTLALSGAGAISNSAVVAVNSGTLDVSAIAATPFYVNGSLTLTNGTLKLGALTANAINTLNSTNSTLTLIADANVLTLYVTNLVTSGTTNLVNITTINNVPPGPALPYLLPLITYGTATFNGGFNFGLTGFPNAYVSNDIPTSTIYLVLTAEPYVVTWNGGSSTGNNWSDAANWNNVAIGAGDSLTFDGSLRTVNNNDTAPGTVYTNITFNGTADPFTLSGNPITLGGSIVNNSANTDTILLGINFSGSRALNGASGPLIIGGGITNTIVGNGSATLSLAGTGILTNNFGTAAPAGGTNLLLVNDAAANWTLLDNAASSTVTVPWAFGINNGTFNFGVGANAPKFTSTSAQGSPQDNQIGTISGGIGTLNISNGTYTTTARVNTGAAGNGTGVFNVYAGTVNVGSQFQGANGANTSFSYVTNYGGAVNIGSAATPTGTFFVASRGNGTLTMEGGVLNCGVLDTSRNAAGNTGGSIGQVNLNGGLLTVTGVTNTSANAQAGGSPTAQINYNGGTLKARANFIYQGNTSTPFIPITSLVQAGGAIIDTTNFSVTFNEPLQYDANLAGVQDGGLVKKGSGTLVLSQTSTYIGDSVVSNGTLVVNGALGTTAIRVAAGGTLAGTGSVGSNVLVQMGGTISPASAGTNGTLTVALNVVLQGTTAMDIDQATASSDLLRSTDGSITYGGTLAITNLAGTLTTNDTFTLFSASGYSGSFAAISPASPGPGLAWYTNTLALDGILRLTNSGVATYPTNITASVSGNVLSLSWPAEHLGWTLQAQTNSLSTGLSPGGWVNVGGSASVNSVNITIDPATGAVFYRLTYP